MHPQICWEGSWREKEEADLQKEQKLPGERVPGPEGGVGLLVNGMV